MAAMRSITVKNAQRKQKKRENNLEQKSFFVTFNLHLTSHRNNNIKRDKVL